MTTYLYRARCKLIVKKSAVPDTVCRFGYQPSLTARELEITRNNPLITISRKFLCNIKNKRRS